MHATLDERQRLQTVLFPEGLTVDGESFGNAVTGYAFNYLQQTGDDEAHMGGHSGADRLLKPASTINDKDLERASDSKSCLATPTGFEPVFQA